MALFSYPVCTWLCQYVNMGVRKWLEKSAEKQKYKMRKTANPLSRKAFRAVSFSATKDIGVSRSDTPIFCCGFLDFLILLEGIVQLFPLGSLYAEGLILYFIQEGSYDLRKLQLPHQADPAPQSILRQRKVEDSHHTKVSEETRRF